MAKPKVFEDELIFISHDDTEYLKRFCRICGKYFQVDDCIRLSKGKARRGLYRRLTHLDCLTVPITEEKLL